MNILKHMEAVFVASMVLAISSSYVSDLLPQAHAKPVASVRADTKTAVVVVSAKRMSAEEKLQASLN
jgi:hypothetical protein